MNKNKFFTLSAFVSLIIHPVLSVSAEVEKPAMDWIQFKGASGDDRFNAITQTPDKGFVVVGEHNPSGYYGSRVVKYDENGSVLWERDWGGNNHDYLTSVTALDTGEIIAVGSSSSTNAGFTLQAYEDAVLVKYDTDGTLLSTKSFAVGTQSQQKFNQVIPTSDGGLLAVGYTSTNSNRDGLIVKYSISGSQEWYGTFGGNKDDIFQTVAELSDGSFVVGGTSESTNAGFTNKGYKDAILVKYTSTGSRQWVKSFGGNNYDDFTSIISTSDGGFVATGDSSSTNAGFTNKGRSDGVLIKYSSDGISQWTQTWGGSNQDNFVAATTSPDNGFLIVGRSYSSDAGFSAKGSADAFLLKCSEDGTFEWIEDWGGNNYDEFKAILSTNDGSILVAGDSGSSDVVPNLQGYYDSVIIKYRDNQIKTSGQTELTGTFTPVMASVTIPTSEVLFTLDPNQEAGQQFIAPEFELINNSNGPIRLSIHNFEQKTSILNDVLPSQHLDWTTLNKEKSKDIALAITPQPSDGWVSLLEGPRYVVEPSNYDLGIIKPGSTVSFQLEAIHGLAFSEPLFPQYELSFVFDLK